MFTWSNFTKLCKHCGFCYQVQILALFLTEVIGTVITLWQGSDYQHGFSMLMPIPALKSCILFGGEEWGGEEICVSGASIWCILMTQPVGVLLLSVTKAMPNT